MVTEHQIRDRFLNCINDLAPTHTVKEIAEVISTHASYIHKLKSSDNPSIPAAMIANFCIKFHYSVFYILLGKGEMKTPNPKSKEEKWEAEREKYLNLIGKLLDGLLEVKAEWNDPLSQLVNEAGRKRNKQ